MATYHALLSLKSSLDDPDSRLSALRLLNVFNRTFPPELSNLTNLRVLDLYNNNLTGVLPVSVATFHSQAHIGEPKPDLDTQIGLSHFRLCRSVVAVRGSGVGLDRLLCTNHCRRYAFLHKQMPRSASNSTPSLLQSPI
ncbi:hypothetical protein ACLB2K_026828 [Fragaria x ananassa]